MQLSWLQDFVEFARVRSVTKAAENRHITHPAFGRRIKALEDWAGVPLIKRTKPIELTSEGRIFLDAAVDILKITGLLRQRLSRHITGNPHVTIATGMAISSTFFPKWYNELIEALGFFQVKVIAGSIERAITALTSQEADLLLAYSSGDTLLRLSPARFDNLTIGHENLVPISAPRRLGNPKFTGQKSRPDPWLTYSTTTALHSIINHHIANLKNQPNLKIAHESDSFNSILELTANGVGLSWLPYRLVEPELKKGRVVIIDCPGWPLGINLTLYRRKFFSQPVIDRIWSYHSYAVPIGHADVQNKHE